MKQYNQFSQMNISEINNLKQIISQKDNELAQLKLKIRDEKVYMKDKF